MFDSKEEHKGINIRPEIYVHILTILFVVILAVKYSLKWFISKDLYPLKEKSPILSIVMIISIGIQLLIFPLLYSTNYLTSVFLEMRTKFGYRALQAGLEFSVYGVYFLRCLRVIYAHETSPARKNTLPFWIFKDDYKLALIVVIVGFLRASVVMLYY